MDVINSEEPTTSEKAGRKPPRTGVARCKAGCTLVWKDSPSGVVATCQPEDKCTRPNVYGGGIYDSEAQQPEHGLVNQG